MKTSLTFQIFQGLFTGRHSILMPHNMLQTMVAGGVAGAVEAVGAKAIGALQPFIKAIILSNGHAGMKPCLPGACDKNSWRNYAKTEYYSAA
jgi:hypothetical protein